MRAAYLEQHRLLSGISKIQSFPCPYHRGQRLAVVKFPVCTRFLPPAPPAPLQTEHSGGFSFRTVCARRSRQVSMSSAANRAPPLTHSETFLKLVSAPRLTFFCLPLLTPTSPPSARGAAAVSAPAEA